MSAAVEAQLDPVMHQPLAAHPLSYARRVEQVHRALLENSRADTLLHMFAALRLNHYGLDALPVEQVSQQQTRGSGSDDAHLSASGVGK
jgi:hypothetical protein